MLSWVHVEPTLNITIPEKIGNIYALVISPHPPPPHLQNKNWNFLFPFLEESISSYSPIIVIIFAVYTIIVLQKYLVCLPVWKALGVVPVVCVVSPTGLRLAQGSWTMEGL